MMEPHSVVKGFVDKLSQLIGQVVFGQREVIVPLCLGYFAGGHVLLEGPPGVAKTLLAKTLARTLGRKFARIQFTPDLMPSDITGVNIFDQKSATFRFTPGPLLTELLLADEINRTPPKTQSALLEAMEERSVTIDGVLYPLGDLFFVIATQNPIEHEGTFPLPEAQLDRFMLKLEMGYPDKASESHMIETLTGEHVPETLLPDSVCAAEELLEARRAVRMITCAPALASYIGEILTATRAHQDLLLGASPRAGLHIGLMAKAMAASQERSFVIPDDVKAVARWCLGHRLHLKPELYGSRRTTGIIVQEVLERVPVPSHVSGV